MIRALLPSWRRSLTARRVSPRTISTYQTSAAQLGAFLAARDAPSELSGIRREHVEAFIEQPLAIKAPATAHNRCRGCQAFFEWCVDEVEVSESPMACMRPPRLDEAPPPVLREAELMRLLEPPEGDRTRAGIRDAAILRLFVDTGIRRGELLGIAVATWTSTRGSWTWTARRAVGAWRLATRPPRPAPVPACAHETPRRG